MIHADMKHDLEHISCSGFINQDVGGTSIRTHFTAFTTSFGNAAHTQGDYLVFWEPIQCGTS